MVPESAIQVRGLFCFPRASGDGPLLAVQVFVPDLFPPRERGWSHRHRHGQGPAGVSPARAGMVQSSSVRQLPMSRFPRASGDGPSTICTARWGAQFPPRERGWSQAAALFRAFEHVSPARAGMVQSSSVRQLPMSRFPRASGDGPQRLMLQQDADGFPPRERGWSLHHLHGAVGRAVSPARAGMVPTCCCWTSVPVSFPRASGDGPRLPRCFGRSSTFPPRERGWSLYGYPALRDQRVSPARAGMVRRRSGHRPA